MKKTLIRESLLGLSKKDRKSFLRFIHSPYFNTRNDLILLAEFFLAGDVLDSDNLTKKDVFHAVFEEENYSDQKIRLLLSYLQKKIEHFLTIEELQKSEGETSWLMLSALKNKNLKRNYAKKLNYFRHQLDKRERQDWSYYYEKYRIELLNLDVSTIPSKKQGFNYEVLTDSLRRYYLSAKLRHACSAILYQSVFDQNYKFPMLDDVLKIASQEKYLKAPAISIYYHFLRAMNGGAEVDFSTLKNILFQQGSTLSKQEFYEIYTMVLNFYIRTINNQNRLDLISDLLGLYKKGLDLGFLLDSGFIDRYKYSNIVACGLKVGDLEWTNSFIESYRLLLRKEYRKMTYSLNKARLAYVSKNYDEALELIEIVNYNELVYAVTARILKIKIYWELSKLELMDHQLHSLKFFLKRKKVVGYHYQLWTNIINYTRKLAEINPFDKEKIAKLKEEIIAEDILTEKAWLLEQLDKL